MDSLVRFLFYIFSAIFVILFFWFANEATSLTKEDGVIEWVSAFFYIGSAIAAMMFFSKSFYKWLSVFWIIFSIFCFGEETSWLQRQLGYSVPWVEQNNLQQEFNFHNYKIFGSGKALDKQGNPEFDISLFFSAQMIFQAGLLIYFLMIPLLRNKIILIRRFFPEIPSGFLFVFWFLVILSFLLSFQSEQMIRNGLAETRECLFAFFIMAHQPFFIFSNIAEK